MERIKVSLINDPNIAYKKVDVDNYNEEMSLKPLSSNPFQNFRIPSNYLVTDAKILGMSNLILNKKNICAINNIVFNVRNNDKIFHESEKSIKYNFIKKLLYTCAEAGYQKYKFVVLGEDS